MIGSQIPVAKAAELPIEPAPTAAAKALPSWLQPASAPEAAPAPSEPFKVFCSSLGPGFITIIYMISYEYIYIYIYIL
jgi:hypothetical protein